MKKIIVFNESLINLDYLQYVSNPNSVDNKNLVMRIIFSKGNGIEFTYSLEEERKEDFNRLIELIKQEEKIQMNKFEATENWYKKAAEAFVIK